MTVNATQVHWIEGTRQSHRDEGSVRDVDLFDLAQIVDALIADGRCDLAALVVAVIYHCAERKTDESVVIPFLAIKEDRFP